MPFQTTATSSALFLGIFILAFFPNVFIYILRIPFAIPSALVARSAQLPPQPTVQISYDQIRTLENRIAGLEARGNMSWFQKQFTLPSKSRGAYLVTDDVVKQLPEIKDYKVGLLNLFVQHTSCALSLNENYDEEVRYAYTLSKVHLGWLPESRESRERLALTRN